MKKKVDFISLKIYREKTVEYESKGIWSFILPYRQIDYCIWIEC